MQDLAVHSNNGDLNEREASAMRRATGFHPSFSGVLIPDFERYVVDALGDVFVLTKTSRTGRVIALDLPRKLKKALDVYGYEIVSLNSCEAKNKTKKVHRLVAEIFIPNPEQKPQVNHINGIKHDNRVENLEWVSSSENITHSFQVLGNKPTSYWTGKNNPHLSQPIIVINAKSRAISRYSSQKALIQTGRVSASSITKKIDTNTPVRGLLIYRESYVKAYHADVWMEAYGIEVAA